MYFICHVTPQDHSVKMLCSLSNSRLVSVNADVIADVIFSANSKVQNYQCKAGEKSLYPSKHVHITYFEGF